MYWLGVVKMSDSACVVKQQHPDLKRWSTEVTYATSQTHYISTEQAVIRSLQ